MREAAHRSSAGMPKATFPKPKGYDNDLIRALELMLLGARKYADKISPATGNVSVKGARVKDPEPDTPREKMKRHIAQRTAGFNVTNIDVKMSTD